jgi:replicative DNA helicase
MGKSALAMNIADYVATDTGVATLFVSLEMSRLEIGERFLSARSGVDTSRFKNPEVLSVSDRCSMGRAYDEIRKSRLFIDDTAHRTLTQIAANARRLRSKHNIGLLIVDYIQLIDGQRIKGESRQEEVARISKRLKGIAREIHAPVIALAQLNRQSESREDRRPRLSDLRESGQLEADADVVLLLHRPDYYDPSDRPGEAELIVAKNRNGATGNVRLVFLRHCTKFGSLAPPGLRDPIGDEAF